MKDVNTIVGENIQHYRRRQGLTQHQLARRIGVTYQAISKWETGKSTPDIALLPELARVFECRIDDFFIRSA
ncbi:MAG: helix-turn-helix transcriptional regulator [Clostridia bacterium]|nr:helix-turn-helix transcriptional regulator [Clostridia bacterium]